MKIHIQIFRTVPLRKRVSCLQRRFVQKHSAYFRHFRQIADINGFEFEQCCSLNTGLSQRLITILEFQYAAVQLLFFSFGN